MIDIEDLMDEKIDEYIDKYGSFPMFELGRTREPEEIIDIINECFVSGKDVYQLGYLRHGTVY